MGVGPIPTSTTCAPLCVRPSTSAANRRSLDRRQSRPTAMRDLLPASPAPSDRREPRPIAAGDLVGQIAVGDAADVVFAETVSWGPAWGGNVARPGRPPRKPARDLCVAGFAAAWIALAPAPARRVRLRPPGDIYPRGARERELCEPVEPPRLALPVGRSCCWTPGPSPGRERPRRSRTRRACSCDARPRRRGAGMGAPAVGGAWLALPKCSPTWLGEPPREGAVRAHGRSPCRSPFSGATAPVVNAHRRRGPALGLEHDRGADDARRRGRGRGVRRGARPLRHPPQGRGAAASSSACASTTDARGVFVG